MYILNMGVLLVSFLRGLTNISIFTLNNGGGLISIYIKPGNGGAAFWHKASFKFLTNWGFKASVRFFLNPQINLWGFSAYGITLLVTINFFRLHLGQCIYVHKDCNSRAWSCFFSSTQTGISLFSIPTFIITQ